MRNDNHNGLTLAELLIVVAIIGVLVSISIPIFAKQLEKSRESVDLSNVRSSYALVAASSIEGRATDPVKSDTAGAFYLDIELKQKEQGWQTSLPIEIAGVSSTDSVHWLGTPKANGSCQVKILNEETFLFWNGSVLSSLTGTTYDAESFWEQQKNQDGSVTLYKKDYRNESFKKNSVSPIVLQKGDSFTVPSNCLVKPGTYYREGIFAFYLAKPNSNKKYTPLVDSGWLDTDDLKTFTRANNNITVENPDDYYIVEAVGDAIKVTITDPEGLTLLINNNLKTAGSTLMNSVYVEKG